MENIENKIPNGENQDTQNSSFFSENVSSSNGLEPKIRFVNFKENYRPLKIGDIYAERSERGAENMELLSVTINEGVKKRMDIDGKDTSSEDKSNYKIVHTGDMVYNSMRMWQGANGISDYDGIVSPAYTVLKSKGNIHNQYIGFLFKNSELINKFRKNSQGLTSDTWNLKYPQIACIKINIPSLDEQQKIADFLSLVDQRIEKQRQLVESLKKYKRGYFQRIISSLETSSFELKNIVDEYNAKSKIQNEFPILSSTLSGIKLQNDYFNKQAASETTIGYKIVPFGYFTYRSMSDTGEFRFNLQNIIEKGIVSPAYPVFKVKEEYNAEFVEYILNETDNIKSQLLIKKEGGTRYALSFSKFQTLKIDLPIKNAQDKTVSQLRFINKVLTNEERILSNLQKLKNGLLQQMFI